MECQRDIWAGRKENDKVSAKNNLSNKHFNSISINLSGNLLLAGGNSAYVCLYDIHFQILLKKFKLSQNRSLDGLLHKLNSQYKFNELDNDEDKYDSNNSDYEIEDSNGILYSSSKKNTKKHLPIVITKVAFSFTNRSFIVASTEGIFFYSLDVENNFGNLILNEKINPSMCLQAYKEKNYEKAIVYCIYLNLSDVLDVIINSINHERTEIICGRLPVNVIFALLIYFSKRLEKDNNIGLNLIWTINLLKCIKNNSSIVSNKNNTNLFSNLSKSIQKNYKNITKLLEENVFSLEFLLSLNI